MHISTSLPRCALPSLRFYTNCVLFFVDLRVFLKTYGLLVLLKVACFFVDFVLRIAFFNHMVPLLF